MIRVLINGFMGKVDKLNDIFFRVVGMLAATSWLGFVGHKAEKLKIDYLTFGLGLLEKIGLAFIYLYVAYLLINCFFEYQHKLKTNYKVIDFIVSLNALVLVLIICSFLYSLTKLLIANNIYG